MFFLIVALIAAVIGIVGVVNLGNIAREDRELYQENTLGLKDAGEANRQFLINGCVFGNGG